MQIEPLDILKTYFWKIVVKDSRGGMTAGPVWSFTTINNPPNAPVYQLPHHSGEIVPENVRLTWAEATDPNPGDTISGYDIYFGTTSSPPLAASNHNDTHYSAGNLNPDTTYFWKIVARDNHDAQSPGSPLWSFKTYDHAPVVLSNPTYSSDTTLTKNGGPYIVQGSMTIDLGVVLTIEPGTIFKFENGATLKVNGTLAAQGNAGNQIIFTSCKDDRYGGDTNGDGNASAPDRGDWGGISVTIGPSSGAVTLKYCRIEFATTGISVAVDGNSAALTITENVIRNHLEDGIFVDGRNGASISAALSNNQVEENGGNGIHFYTTDQSSQLSGQISASVISQNEGYGIYVHTYSKALCDLDIIGNTIGHNQDSGIYAFSHYAYQYTTLLTIKNNTIDESGTGIYCYAALSEMSADIIGNVCRNGNDGIKCIGYSGARPLYALITDNEVYANSNIGIYCYSRSAKLYPEIRQNKVYNNQNGGVHCLRYDEGVNHIIEPVITLNEVYENEGYGIFCHTSAEAILLYNEVRSNLSTGVYIKDNDVSVIHFNNMYNNAGSSEMENGNTTAVNARFNYWGSYGTYEIESGNNPKNISRIYDIYDDIERGTAYYMPSLPSILALPSTHVSKITSPLTDHEQKSSVVNIKGIAVSPNGVDFVEVSTDNGMTWTTADGAESWNIELTFPGDGTYTVLSRVTDKLSQVETPGSGVTFTVNSSLPTTKGTLTGNETWSGEVAITGDVIVPQGVTLTIDPG
ncbi:MAG: right-handed parallel beta-helix repeat-containing protein, partial [Thermodesulfobacteriota bacterium]|nr:right-handed parallel beta-helix repeat-containing protein [Thermodesulfobacteriota bacterium]